MSVEDKAAEALHAAKVSGERRLRRSAKRDWEGGMSCLVVLIYRRRLGGSKVPVA